MKDRILGWLFPKFVEKTKQEARKDVAESIQIGIDAYKATLKPQDAVRERLKGIRPNHPESRLASIDEKLGDMDEASRLAFLSNIFDIWKKNVDNEDKEQEEIAMPLKLVLESLMIDQFHATALEAGDMTEVNFGRATVNGLILLEDELERLANVYLEERNRNKTMSEEEEFSAI